MFFFRLSKYIKYLLFSRHRRGHGIHSPFVFNLVTKVFRNKINPDIVCKIEEIRKKNTSDYRVINVTDLGAGSVKLRNSKRKVSEISRYSSVPPGYGALLSNLAAEFGKPAIIEFGTSLGISTMYLAVSDPEVKVYTMEGCPETSAIALENFRLAGVDNIKLMNGPFDDLLPEIAEKGIRPGMVFIDGNHRKEPLLHYFKRMADLSDNRTLIIIDDIHISPEMEEAWTEIKRLDNISVTIDLFRMGLVFFRKGISRFDYVIRY